MIDQSPSIEVNRLIRFNGGGTVRAYCDIAVGGVFLLKGLRVVDGKNGLFVSMPRQQGKDGKWWDSITILTKEAKVEVNRVILEVYNQQEEQELANTSHART